MLDIVEGAKIMFGGAATGSAASKYGDWINMENLHSITAVVVGSPSAVAVEFIGCVAQDYTGASPSTAVCQYWYSTGVLIDKMVQSTETTGHTLNVLGGVGVCKYVNTGDSTDQYFSVQYTSGTAANRTSIVYFGDTRYKGLNQILATSSST